MSKLVITPKKQEKEFFTKIPPLPGLEYTQNFSSMPEISSDSIPDSRFGKITYIYTDRFKAQSLYSPKEKFDEFGNEIQQLYRVTFGDPEVMAKYSHGNVRTPEQFEVTVNLQSIRWNYGYPFSAFMVTDKDTDKIVGYEVIGNSEVRNQGEMAYLFSKEYHRGENWKNVGYENIGALCLEYGKSLYDSKQFVNKSFNKTYSTFEGGEIFNGITATSRDDNIASYKILGKLGFCYKEDNFKFGHNRHIFDKFFITDEVILDYMGDYNETCDDLA